jgi:hypothetical protein
MKLCAGHHGNVIDMASNESIVSSSPRDAPAWSSLTPLELTALREASGAPVNEDSIHHPICRDLELRGYLRRIVSFDPQRYRQHDTGPRFSWTRTEQGENALLRSRWS